MIQVGTKVKTYIESHPGDLLYSYLNSKEAVVVEVIVASNLSIPLYMVAWPTGLTTTIDKILNGQEIQAKTCSPLYLLNRKSELKNNACYTLPLYESEIAPI